MSAFGMMILRKEVSLGSSETAMVRASFTASPIALALSNFSHAVNRLSAGRNNIADANAAFKYLGYHEIESVLYHNIKSSEIRKFLS